MYNIKLFAFLFSFLHAFYGLAQTVLMGQVTDEATKEALIGASVKVTRGGETIRGVITDFDGNYRITLDPGKYDLSVSYTGYQTQYVNGVQVFANTLNKLDFTLSQGALLQEVVITQYKVPLIKQDETSTGQVMTLNGVQSGGYSPKKKRKREEINQNAPNPKQVNQSQAINKYLKHLRDSLGKEASQEQYNPIVENPFQEAAKGNVSTFSIDVDGASYANIRRFLNNGSLPDKDAVRVEEFINRFDYQYSKPKGEHPFEVNTEMAPCPWQPNHRLLRIGLQGMEADHGQLPASNLVFLVDVSGSMGSPDKLPLVQASLSLLADQLRAVDRVALVVYAGAAGLVLESTPGSEKAKIKQAIQNLQAGGSTAGGAGIQLAYAKAREYLIPNGNNRVILCTDGDFNVGTSDQAELVKLIEKERESGVYLTVLGFGTGNYQEGTMQMLANKGNGNHGYVDQLSEAKRLFVKEFGGTLFTIAKDVKLQLHFNPQQVAAYRLIGYENRLLAKEDFHDDTKDAGELGLGHRVTALYEIIPTGQPLPPQSTLDAALTVVEKPRNDLNIKADDLFALQLRYKKTKGKAPSRLMEYRFNAAAMTTDNEPSPDFQLAAVAATFGLLLRDSKYKGNATYSAILERANALAAHGSDEVVELAELIEKAGRLAGQLK